MIWLPLVLTCTFLVAVRNVILRKVLLRADATLVVYSEFLIAACLSVLLLCFIPIPEIRPAFYHSIVISSVLDTIAAVLMFRAIAASGLAKTFPLIAFTPIFLIVTSFLILGELPSLLGVAGILTIVTGAYLLRLENLSDSVFEPFRLLVRERSAVYMLLVALLLSFVGPFFKQAIVSSSPYFALAISQLICVSIFGIFTLRKNYWKPLYSTLKDNFTLLFLGGVGGFVGSIALFHAFELALASYVVSVNRMSIMFTIIFGYLFFREEGVVKNIIAGAFMTLGVVFISFG